jgi:hypothetical protein
MNEFKNIFLFGILMVFILFLSSCNNMQNDISNNLNDKNDSVNQQTNVVDTPNFDPTKPIVPPKIPVNTADSKEDSDVGDDEVVTKNETLTDSTSSVNLVYCGDYILDINSKEHPPNNCFLERAKTCVPTKLDLTIKTGDVDVIGSYEIVGLEENSCLIKEISSESSRDCYYDLDSLEKLSSVYDMLMIKKDCK